MDNNQKIKCSVKSCKFQDCDCCTLKEIHVGCNCGSCKAVTDQETLCRSFKCDQEKTDSDK